MVTFDVDGVKEIIWHGENGFILLSEDVDKMCEYLEHLLDGDIWRSLQRVQGA